MTFKFTPRFKRSSGKAGKVAKNPSFTHRMNEMDEWDAYVTDKTVTKGSDGIETWVFREQLDGTSGHDQITINQRAHVADPEANVEFYTRISAGDGNDIITNKHQDQMRIHQGGQGYSCSKITVFGGRGRDSFVVEGNNDHFVVSDMEVGETITVAGKYKEAVENGMWGGYGGNDTSVSGREFFNFEDKFGNDSRRLGVWLSEGTELVRSRGENNTAIFTLVEV